jgi:hypothetical protein
VTFLICARFPDRGHARGMFPAPTRITELGVKYVRRFAGQLNDRTMPEQTSRGANPGKGGAILKWPACPTFGTTRVWGRTCSAGAVVVYDAQ